MTEALLANRTGDVDAFIRSLEHPLASAVQDIRLAILAIDDRITEHIKWKAPSFGRDNDDRVTFQLRHPQRIQLIFHRGAKVKDTLGFTFADDTDLISWAAPDRGIVTFASQDEVNTSLSALVTLVQRWMDATST
jgi:hypothetical protein